MLMPPRPGQPITSDLPTDEEAQVWVDYLANQQPNIGMAIGYDNFPMLQSQPEASELVFSHTFPMSESERDPQGVIEFEHLLDESPPSLQMIPDNIDATNAESLTKLVPYLPEGKADVFTFSASYFEMDPDRQKDFFRNFLPYCNERALFFVSEFARLNPQSPNGIKVIRGDWWHRLGSFGTFIVDPFNLDKPPVEIGRFLTRRCEAMWLTKAGKSILSGY
jgi:hypothetical protein